MKSILIFRSLLILSILFITSCQEKTADIKESNPLNDISQYIGHWTIDIEGGGVGWLGVSQEDGYLDGGIMWIGGSVNPVVNMYFSDNILYAVRDSRKVVRESDDNGLEIKSQMVSSWLEIELEKEGISGYLLKPRHDGMGIDSTSFVGAKLPELGNPPELSSLKYGDPIALLNGEDIAGWELVEPNKVNGWSVVDGVLINNPIQKEGEQHIRYGNLRTIEEFEDFNIKLEINIPAHSNSGVYLRGRHEIQVVDSYGSKLDSHNMGALYSRITPSVAAEKPAGTWQTMDITLCDRHVTVILNDITIIDNQRVLGPTGGALTSDVFAPGPIYLQGDHGKISYRNIILTPIVK